MLWKWSPHLVLVAVVAAVGAGRKGGQKGANCVQRSASIKAYQKSADAFACWMRIWEACCGVLPRGVLKSQKKNLRHANRNERSRDALCFTVETWERHKTTETVLNNGWLLATVGG